MNERIDVLAVMDDAITGLSYWNMQTAEMSEARAAVAELLEADREYDAARDDLATQRRQVGAMEAASARVLRANERRRAALARVGAP